MSDHRSNNAGRVYDARPLHVKRPMSPAQRVAIVVALCLALIVLGTAWQANSADGHVVTWCQGNGQRVTTLVKGGKIVQLAATEDISGCWSPTAPPLMSPSVGG